MSQLSGSTTYSMTRGSALALVHTITHLLAGDQYADGDDRVGRIFLTVERKKEKNRHRMFINDGKSILVRNDSEEICESCGIWLDEVRTPHVQQLCPDCKEREHEQQPS